MNDDHYLENYIPPGPPESHPRPYYADSIPTRAPRRTVVDEPTYLPDLAFIAGDIWDCGGSEGDAQQTVFHLPDIVVFGMLIAWYRNKAAKWRREYEAGNRRAAFRVVEGGGQ